MQWIFNVQTDEEGSGKSLRTRKAFPRECCWTCFWCCSQGSPSSMWNARVYILRLCLKPFFRHLSHDLWQSNLYHFITEKRKHFGHCWTFYFAFWGVNERQHTVKREKRELGNGSWDSSRWWKNVCYLSKCTLASYNPPPFC